MAKYQPPKQSRGLQVFDIVFLLAAIFIALWLPLQLGLAGAEKTLTAIENPTWEALGQNETMVAAWEKLGMDVQAAHDVIQNRFDYSINYLQLGILFIVLVGYFVFLFKASEAEYKEVIDEKFNNK